MFRLSFVRSVYLWSASFTSGAMLVLLLSQPNAMADEVTALFQEAHTTAIQLNKDAATMESYTRSNLSWQSHRTQITEIKEHINKAGSILSQMQSARADAKPWHQVTIDGLTPVLKQLANNTESIINHLNETPKRLNDPSYVQYLKANAQSASELSAAVGNIVEYDKTRTKMAELEAKLGWR